MPGPALHHLIAQRLTTSIRCGTGLGRNLSRPDYEALQALLANAGNHPYLYLGCQGPDFFFFNTKDMNPTLGKFVEFYYQVYDFIEEFKQTLLKAVPQPVLDALEAFDETIEDSMLLSGLKQTFDDLNKLLKGFLANLMGALKRFVSEPTQDHHVGQLNVNTTPQGSAYRFQLIHLPYANEQLALMAMTEAENKPMQRTIFNLPIPDFGWQRGEAAGINLVATNLVNGETKVALP